VLVVPFLTIVLRGRPSASVQLKAAESGKELPGYEVGEAISTRVFWMLAAAQLFWGLSAGAVIHIVAYLTGIGYTLQFATTAFASLAGLAALGKATMGAVGDRIGGKNALALALLLIGVAHILALGAQHEGLLLVYLLVIGLTVASPVALAPLVLAESMGLRRFGTLYGWIQVPAMLGLFGGPLLAGEFYDLTHSYAMSFEVGALLAAAGAAAGFLCSAPRPLGVTLPTPAHSTAG
jgi:MFS family permease